MNLLGVDKMAIVGIILIVISYFLGSISSSIIISKMFGVADIREHGSGNAGATNVLRTVGKKAAFLTFIFDVLKGAVPIIIMNVLKFSLVFMLAAGFAAVLGHIFPIYFGFKGGKGVSTSFGAVITLSILTGLWGIIAILVAVWLVTVVMTKYVSLGSVIVYGLYPLLVIFFGRSVPFYAYYVAFAVLIGILGIVMHRKNIERLLNGTESKIGHKTK